MPSHIYEGSESEDEETSMMSRRVVVDQKADEANPGFRHQGPETMIKSLERFKMNEPALVRGQMVSPFESFALLQAIKSYPFVYVRKASQARVANHYWDKDQLYDHTWDFFYLYQGGPGTTQPLLLVPTQQFQRFLIQINQKLGMKLAIPIGKQVFAVTFEHDGNPVPRFLGRSKSKAASEQLKNSIPWPTWRPEGEPEMHLELETQSMIAFRAKFQALVQAAKGRKGASKQNLQNKRIAKQQSWLREIKKVQCSLGVRLTSTFTNQNDEVVASAFYSAEAPAPFAQEGSVVFIAIDVEAWEKSKHIITEIGIATLDTKDLVDVAPGELGKEWRSKVRARHFRIDENKRYQNSEFITGCPDRFEFGTSEFINLRDTPQAVASCFRPPYSKEGGKEQEKRNVVLVGHDIEGDIKYLQTIGYNLENLANVYGIVDTTRMFRYIKQETNSRSLGTILTDLEITGWNLHNAGNDAVYTIFAMLGIALKHLDNNAMRRETHSMREMLPNQRIENTKVNTLEHIEGWSSSEEDSEGGAPVRLKDPAAVAPVTIVTAPHISQVEEQQYPYETNYTVHETYDLTPAQRFGHSRPPSVAEDATHDTSDPYHKHAAAARSKETLLEQATPADDRWVVLPSDDVWAIHNDRANHDPQRW